jgi:hypothetical protein
MRQVTGPAEGASDSGVSRKEKGFLDRSSTNDPSKPPSADPVLLDVEMAIEWAHLGGD